ncbi:MAG TPA: peptidoglycan bridge formation glycyltransferase FemA/FemB family protein [Dictyobacter sp.]|jgi:lipid II:glycine glycyltransferase (peptidoglycan interpeptide bridge formation enzyme)|nr:peptidoglycan bridge formation glycyltransferase FemA/FemB family protein [Dictyobacter sp.]
MEARFITDAQQWNDFVAASPYGVITQAYEWGELARHAGSNPMRVGVVDESGKLCAAMAINISKMPMLRSTYFYAPRGPIVDDPDSPALTVLLNFVKAEARKQGAFMLKIDPPAEEGDTHWVSALTHRGFRLSPQTIHARSEWILDIRPEEKELLSKMKEKWRYNIRLAARKGVTVRRGEGRLDLEAFHTILRETSIRDQFFVHDLDHYQTLMDIFDRDDQVALFLAEFEGKPIAGIFMMRYGRWSWYRYGASSSQYRNVMPNHLLQWNGMQWARSHGCWYYNFLGVPVHPEQSDSSDPLYGVYTFKRGFGGYDRLSLEAYDLPYNPIVYELYRRMIDFKHWRDQRQSAKEAAAREQEASAQTEKKAEPQASKA